MSSITEIKTPPPVDSSSAPDGVSIHLSYIRRDIDEMKQSLKDLKSGYVSLSDFAEHLKADADHETRIRSIEGFKDTLIGKLVGAGIVIGAVFAGISLIINNFWQ
jgi:hypothetical protein